MVAVNAGRKKGCLGILGRGLTGRSAQSYCNRYHQAYEIWDQHDIAESERAQSLEQWIARCDRFLISPGVSPYKALYQPLLKHDCFSDIQLFCQQVPACRFIYVTGSNGKTSTVDLLQHLLKAIGQRVHALGNNENPVLTEIENVKQGDWIILELSSAQLWWTKELPVAQCAVITSWSPNHLDWHSSLDDYRRCKLKVLNWAHAAFHPKEIHGDDIPAHSQQWPVSLSAHAQKIFDSLSDSVRLSPSRYAVLCCLHIAETLGWDLALLAPAFQRWSLLPYRSERRKRHGIEWINDSKSTTYASTQAMVDSLPGDKSRKWLILGGVLKGQNPFDFSPLTDKVENILLIGESAPILDEVLRPCCQIVGDLEHAFELIRVLPMQHRPEFVIFSPGAASFDQFDHYKHRGQCFWNFVESFYDSPSVAS